MNDQKISDNELRNSMQTSNSINKKKAKLLVNSNYYNNRKTKITIFNLGTMRIHHF